MEKRYRNRTLSVIVLASSFVLAAMVAVLTGADPASAKRLGYDAVDGNQIRYVINTRFGDEARFAAAAWNKVGRIAIRQEGSGTDLEFNDYSRKDGFLAYYQPRSGADLINFNVPEMNKISASGKRWTAVHELGHALGLDHPSKKVKNRAVMYPVCCPSFNTPQEHDKKVYRQIWGGGKSGAQQAPARAATSDAASPVIRPAYAFDAKDDRKLVGRSTNVFVGRVVEESGSDGATLSDSGENSVPQTQFSVEVLNNVKGELGGTVTVSQLGGFDEEEGREVRVEDDSLLESGREYLFSTSYDEETGWYTIVAQPFGAVPVESEEQRAQTEDRFARAEAEQIP